MDTDNSCNVQLSDVKDTSVTPTSPAKEVKKENDDLLTAGTFGFQGEVVKSQEAAMVCMCIDLPCSWLALRLAH